MGAISGQTTVTTAGTEVVLAAAGTRVNGPVAVKALPTNTGVMYVGNDGAGAVSNASGFPLSAGEVIVYEYVGDLNTIWVDASVNGEKVAWAMLGVM